MTRRKTAQTEKARSRQLLEQRLGHTFANPALLELALTHRSFAYEARHGSPPEPISPAHPHQRDQRNAPGSDNEQLEFLGDAILGMVVTEALFRAFPHCSEGELTRLRSALVSRKRLADFGLELGLGEALLLGRSAEVNGGRIKPALLANAAEAVLAAVYLDAGSPAAGSPAAGSPAAASPAAGSPDAGANPAAATAGLAIVQAIADRYLVQPELAAMRQALAEDLGRGALRDHKTLLQELVQARVQITGPCRLQYIDTDQTGPPHQRTFTVEARLIPADPAAAQQVLATAEGSSKKEAQQRAAELALAAFPAQALAPDRKPPA